MNCQGPCLVSSELLCQEQGRPAHSTRTQLEKNKHAAWIFPLFPAMPSMSSAFHVSPNWYLTAAGSSQWQKRKGLGCHPTTFNVRKWSPEQAGSRGQVCGENAGINRSRPQNWVAGERGSSVSQGYLRSSLLSSLCLVALSPHSTSIGLAPHGCLPSSLPLSLLQTAIGSLLDAQF